MPFFLVFKFLTHLFFKDVIFAKYAECTANETIFYYFSCPELTFYDHSKIKLYYLVVNLVANENLYTATLTVNTLVSLAFMFFVKCASKR